MKTYKREVKMASSFGGSMDRNEEGMGLGFDIHHYESVNIRISEWISVFERQNVVVFNFFNFFKYD